MYSYSNASVKQDKDTEMTAFTQTGTMINPELLGKSVSSKSDAKAIRADIALVALWAALVPGLMWLGAIVGF
jgi:hypothetical protein